MAETSNPLAAGVEESKHGEAAPEAKVEEVVGPIVIGGLSMTGGEFTGPRMGMSLTLVRTPAIGGGCSVRVEQLLEGSPAALAGVVPGFVLVMCNGRPLAPPTDANGFGALTLSLSSSQRPLTLAFVPPPPQRALDRSPMKTVNLTALFASGRTHLGLEQGRKRVIQRRFNVGVLEATSGRKASTLRVRPER